MDENEEVAQTETEQTDEVAEETTAEAEEDTTDWKALAEQKEQAFQDQKKRAEKAEAKLKEQPKPKAGDELSSKDILALSSSGISDDEDIDILQKAAKLNGTTIAQAIKDPIVAGILKGKQEERQTAAASSTSNTRRVQNERSGQTLLSNAQNGQLPESKRDIQKLVRTRIGIKE